MWSQQDLSSLTVTWSVPGEVLVTPMVLRSTSSRDSLFPVEIPSSIPVCERVLCLVIFSTKPSEDLSAKGISLFQCLFVCIFNARERCALQASLGACGGRSLPSLV